MSRSEPVAVFAPPVTEALGQLGFQGDFDQGQIELRADGAEIWLRLEPVDAKARGHQIRGAVPKVGMVARSRIYSFRQPPRPGVMERILAAGAGLPPGQTVEHLAETSGLYVRQHWVKPPPPTELAEALQNLAASSIHWLDSVLPELFG